jgi:CheY-like chemotaxis protein
MAGEMNNHILIVDDNLNNLRIAVDILINEDYRITTARSGNEAITALNKAEMDLILLDINMPGMDGFETIDEIKKNEAWKNIPILFVTSHREEELLEKAFRHGCVDFIIKPFRPTEFLARIKSHHSLSLHKRKLNHIVNVQTKQLKETIKELKESKKAKDDFISVMSHELRTPLSGILGMLELLKMPSLKSSHNEFLADLEHSSYRLSKLITDILDFSSLDTPSVIKSQTTISLTHLASQVEQLTTTREKEGIQYTMTIAEDIPCKMTFDLSSTLKVLECIIDNAFKFTKEGSISINMSFDSQNSDHGELNFVISDDGPGIPEELHEKVFEKFFQVDSGVNRYFEGTGLGLAIVKKICDASNSTYSIDSSLENGCSFSITVPVRIPTSISGSNSNENKKSIEDTTVLVVEDIPTNQLFMRKILQIHKCKVLIAADHLEAFKILNEQTPDLIFMDYMLPGMNGTEICKRIRDMGHTKDDLPIIAVTAKADAASRENCLKSGMNDHISKPFSVTEISANLAQYYKME